MIKKIKIKDIKVGDKIIGLDNEPCTVIDKIEEYTPNRMFKITFKNGMKIKCSDNHLWNVYNPDFEDINDILTTEEIYNRICENRFNFVVGIYGDSFNGKSTAVGIKRIKEIKPTKVCCVKVDNNKNSFKCTDRFNRIILTHNCQARFVCGRVGTTASMMALGSAIGTSINGNIKGQGMASFNGANINLQFYFENFDWIIKWYRRCGFDDYGWRKGTNPYMDDVENSEVNEKELDNLFESNDEAKSDSNSDKDNKENIDNYFQFEHSISNIDFAGVHGEVDTTKKQKFE